VEQYADVLSAGWPGVSGEPAGWLLPAPGSLADDITTAIMREVEEYARPGDDAAARAVRRLAHEAVAGFGARVAQTPASAAPASAASGFAAPGFAASGFAARVPPETASAAGLFRDLGRLLAMEGRSLGALQAALRVGARVTWQRLQEHARQGHGNPEAFALIGEAVFWYMDELAASCSAGYTEAKAELAGETSQLRRHLLDLLTSGPAPPLPAVASLAQAVGWPLPRRVAAVALTATAASNPGPLPPGVLADLARRDPCLLIADPDGPGRRRQLATVLRGWPRPGGHPGAAGAPPGQLTAVGPAVPLTEASASLRWAVQALALARRGLVGAVSGVGEAGGIVWCEDHLPTLVLLADADLAATLSREALAPLRRLRPGQADRLARTLLAWLESADDANAAARRLHVHPQTIRYRVRQVSELFGEALNDPDARFRLLLALRVRGLLGG
jgi:PucR C-terminal helix-turn-helix domain